MASTTSCLASRTVFLGLTVLALAAIPAHSAGMVSLGWASGLSATQAEFESPDLHERPGRLAASWEPEREAALDCNTNGVDDALDLAAGTSNDCQPDGFPDECQIAVGPGAGPCISPDTTIVIDILTDYFPSETTWTLEEVDVGQIASGGPYGLSATHFVHTVDACTTSCYIFTILDSFGDGICCGYGLGEYTVTLAGELVCSGGEFGSSESCQFGDCPEPGAIPGCADCQQDGICDDCQLVENDCNENGVPDECDVTTGSGGTSVDCNFNGIPDECEDDCNENGIADGCDIAAGTSPDCQPDGTPDQCQLDRAARGGGGGLLYCPSQPDFPAFRAAFEPASGMPSAYFDARTATPTLDDLLQFDCVYTWVNYAYANRDAMGNVLADYADLGGRVLLGQWCLPTAGNFLGGRIMNPAEGFLPVTGTTFGSGSYAGDGTGCPTEGVTAWSTPFRDNASLTSGATTDGHYTDGVPFVANNPGVSVAYVPSLLFGGFGEGPLTDGALVVANVCYCLCCVPPPSNDCNTNAVPDECDLSAGTSRDCNINGIPDECETDTTLMLALDIKPGSCPNWFNRGSHGVLPVALLGTDFFEPMTVDLSTVRLSRADGVGGQVAPHEGPPGPHSEFEDVGTPFSGAACECHELESDGILDLSMKFETDDLVEMLELDELDPGSLVELVLTGEFLDGCVLVARDCVRLVPPGSTPGLLAVRSNATEPWIEVSPVDDTLDGGGFAGFDRSYPTGSIVTLTAPPAADGQPFTHWLVNGVARRPGVKTIRVIVGEHTTAVAIYQSPAIEIVPQPIESATESLSK